MRKVNRPTITAEYSFTTCISRVRNQGLRNRLTAATPFIIETSDIYALAATRQALHTVPQRAIVNGDVTTAEMEAVYTDRMVKKTAPGRPIYDTLLAAATNEICPLCGHRQATTLDHHLPKAHFPALAVTPTNLVPACKDCNTAKLNKVPTTAAEVSIHPYFDEVDNDRWLKADVVQVQPAILRFRVVPPAGWSQLLSQRVQNHFADLELGKLYAAQAAEELFNIKFQLSKLLDTPAGSVAVRAHLQDMAVSCLEARPNGWRTAAYEAWTECDWFCGGGFS